MSYRWECYTAEWEPAAARYNGRLRAPGKAPYLLPDTALETRTPHLCRQYWLAVDGEGEVRGSCLLQTQPARVCAEPAAVVNVQSPLSEGLSDRRYAGVGAWMIRELMRRHPHAYSVGMGDAGKPYPRLLAALRWRVESVPFFFRVLAGRKFLANLRPLRNHRRLAPAAALGAAIPWLPDLAIEAIHRLRKRPGAAVSAAGDADWERLRTRYGFALERSPEILDSLYPTDDPRFTRTPAAGGIAVLRRSAFHGHPYFGDLSVVTLVEAICETGAERRLLDAVVEKARRLGAELLITNQADSQLCRALQWSGWFSYASNYLAAFSPALAARIGGRPVYLNRGDGDGLVNL